LSGKVGRASNCSVRPKQPLGWVKTTGVAELLVQNS
jgi:hypothetical protein